MKSRAIELELFRHLLASIAEEMGIVLRKTSYSANIKERRDYSCAIYDSAGNAVAMGDHMPVHLGAMPVAVRAVRETFDLAPGDVALVNDPFRGGTHLPDITAVAGIFMPAAKRASFYAANRAHHADVGGISPGSMPLATEIYQEGLRIPPILLQRAGKIDRGLLGMILANVRTPMEREGDLLAQLMSIRRAEQRLHELTAKYGEPVVQRNMRELQNYSERMLRAALRELPPGTYRFEDCIEGDGRSNDPLYVRVGVTLQGDRAVVDFTGSDAQVQGPVNANLAVTTSAVMYVFRCLVPEEIPFTAGILRPIRIIAPEGTIVNALLPAAMAAGNVETSQRITDVVLGALAQAAPRRIPAASAGTMNNLSFGGMDTRHALMSPGRAFAYYETIAGGMGASSNGAGHSATHTHMTNSWNTPVEAFEHQFPVQITSYRIRRNSGGAGLHGGGDGIVREYKFLVPAEVTLLSDRRQRGPYGMSGGKPGKPGRNTLIRGKRTAAVPAKSRFEVQPGDVFRIETPGGGGWGGGGSGKAR
jgi:N-methylhydantoinase B/oxoprolinase/acetone carboxylase alpha subunit